MSKVKALFPYRVSEKAKLGYNIETGEHTSVYMHFALRDNNDEIIEIDESLYKDIQKDKKRISEQLGLKEEWIELISIEEYEANTEED